MVRTRTDIINHLITRRGYRTYLEIGVAQRHNFNYVRTTEKWCVDPNVPADFQVTSDEFFRTNQHRFDLIFIDGHHTHAQSTRDLYNSLAALSPGGTVVMHDCSPTTEHMQLPVYISGDWTGDVWKTIACARMARSDLQMFTVDTDMGVGVIRAGCQTLIAPVPPEYLTYDWLLAHRWEALNLIDPADFERYVRAAPTDILCDAWVRP